jgi:murein DD-endopeptidase MepM/ murein hydrolase activator NlpD
MIRSLALAAMLGMPPAVVAGSCSLGWVCVEPVAADSSVELVARNLQPWPVTVSVRVVTADMQVTPTAEVTQTLGGGERHTLITLRDLDPGTDGSYRYSFDWSVGRQDAIHDDSYVYQLPYASGRDFRVLQGYGAPLSHTGLERWTVDFDMPVGTPVHAARDGVVVRVREKHDRSCWEPYCGRYANFVVVLHDDMTTGEYYHLRQHGVAVEVGQRVEPGDLLGYSGNTGKSTMPHLHFGVYRASSWGRTESVPVRFVTDNGILLQPESGRSYRHP